MSTFLTSCWIPTRDEARPEPPAPESLTYSLTLPAAPQSPAIARGVACLILRAHGLEDVAPAAELVAAELAACACRFTPTDEVYLALRYRDDALRVILYDGHPRHVNTRLSTACDSRRRDALATLAEVVRASQGDWGFGEVRQPGGGTRMWAVLPRAGAYRLPG
ncbi:ATP-binding protein [Streptomyces sp. NPDC101234]|uniref:ATP-binding protein n=1 Tax=Streptomyces sp. NPDC101234 TaxID=3366138 RepID=UPI0038186861